MHSSAAASSATTAQRRSDRPMTTADAASVIQSCWRGRTPLQPSAAMVMAVRRVQAIQRGRRGRQRAEDQLAAILAAEWSRYDALKDPEGTQMQPRKLWSPPDSQTALMRSRVQPSEVTPRPLHYSSSSSASLLLGEAARSLRRLGTFVGRTSTRVKPTSGVRSYHAKASCDSTADAQPQEDSESASGPDSAPVVARFRRGFTSSRRLPAGIPDLVNEERFKRLLAEMHGHQRIGERGFPSWWYGGSALTLGIPSPRQKNPETPATTRTEPRVTQSTAGQQLELPFITPTGGGDHESPSAQAESTDLTTALTGSPGGSQYIDF